MATNTPNTTARRTHHQHVHYLRKEVTFADNGLTVTVGTIPAGSLLLKALSGVDVQVIFNGGTTNTLDIGPSTDTGTNLWATILPLGAIAFVPLDEAVTMKVAVDTVVQAAVVSTAGASTGQATILICYIPNP